MDRILLFCHPVLSIVWDRHMPITAEFIGFHGKKLKKCGGKFIKCRVLWPKTSDFLGTNLRTFHAKPPYFVAKKSDVSGFPAGNVAKIPLFPILRYFGAKQGVVASEAILSPLTTGGGRLGTPENRRRKILHTLSFRPESVASFLWRFPESSGFRHGQDEGLSG